MNTYLTTFDAKKCQLVNAGIVSGRTFIKKVNPKRHFLRIANGYAIQSDVCNQLNEMQVNKIIFNEGNQLRTCSLDIFNQYCEEINLGSGFQKAINIKYLATESKKQLSFV